ncbi:ATP synthase F1 subunit delta [Galbibacter orientalis]|jgi:F-type H+-transporting ATPase subunit delta|uniref:ATP synthase subunit delta n=1 Tax=Galbibacter orientalis DSM 19592 TaxID=926559 RepID=I3C442_9FLAO|nr:ATP synthase F1 subunit delta [Galbibacter orientalis]EIJ38385.1 ATP synthase, F1 delta subunit [Galbibacter orientalis DSM 19592]
MKGTRAGERYAKAVLDLAQEQKVLDVVSADMKDIFNTINGSDELKDLLQSPVIKLSDKRAVLKEIFSGVHAVSTGLIDMLVDNNRVGLLKIIAEKYIILHDKLRGEELAIVTTAVPLSEELEKKVLAKVKELTGNNATIENKIDESIIGGFILRVGDLQYNASIANQLNNLKRDLHNNTYVS